MATPEDNYNRYIAESLNLNENLDFMNDNQAIQKAERIIEERNLNDKYLDSLNSMSRSDKKSIDNFNTGTTEFKALAIVKMLRKHEATKKEQVD